MAPAAAAPEPLAAVAARRRWQFIGCGVALAILPVWRTWNGLATIDGAVTTALILAGALWHLWHHVPPAHSSQVVTAAAWAALAFMSWQLAWLGVEGGWFLRASFLIWPVALTALWGSVARGWRVITACSLWGCWLGAAQPAWTESAGNWIAERTAVAAGWLLWQAGQNVAVHGSLVRIDGGTIEVGAACTGVPLAALLLVLLASAALLLRLRARAWIALAALAVAGSFAIGVVRVTLLILLADHPVAFAYWHGANGGAWFSAAGILLLAAGLGREPSRHTPASAPTVSPETLPVAWRLAVWPVAAGAALSVATAARTPDLPAPAAAPQLTRAEMTRHEVIRPDLPVASPIDAFRWVQRATYHAAGGQIVASLALAPTVFTGDPRTLGALNHCLPPAVNWVRRTTADGADIWQGRMPGRIIWIGMIAPGGTTFAEHDAWVRHYRDEFRDPARWWAWMSHQGSLPDRSAAWVLVSWQTGADETADSESILTAAHAVWRRHAAGLLADRAAVID